MKIDTFRNFCVTNDTITVSIAVNAINSKEIAEAEALISKISERVKAHAFKLPAKKASDSDPQTILVQKSFVGKKKNNIGDAQASKMLALIKSQMSTHPNLVLKEEQNGVQGYIEIDYASNVKSQSEGPNKPMTSNALITDINLNFLKAKFKNRKSKNEYLKLFEKDPNVNMEFLLNDDYFGKLAIARLKTSQKFEECSYGLLALMEKHESPRWMMTEKELFDMSNNDPVTYRKILHTYQMVQTEIATLKAYAFKVATKGTFNKGGYFKEMEEKIKDPTLIKNSLENEIAHKASENQKSKGKPTKKDDTKDKAKQSTTTAEITSMKSGANSKEKITSSGKADSNAKKTN
jgi:hypothetical protein